MTVFICTSRRTEDSNYQNLKWRLEEIARKRGLEGRLKIKTYDFRENLGKADNFNPYIGLINEADHIVVGGESLSMLSEPLAVGKPAIIYEPGMSHGKLYKKGLVIDFKACSADTRFDADAPRIKPVNITEDITDRLIGKFQEAVKKHKPGSAGWVRRTAAKVKHALGF